MGNDICKMKIEVFVLCHNEERIIPYVMRHYNQFARVVILENNSTDRTVDIARSLGARVWEYDVPDVVDDSWYIEVKDSCWKASRADWVIVVDADEFVWHPDIINILKDTKATIIQPMLFEMFSEKFPTTQGQIYDEVKNGVIGGDKINIFRPKEIKEINFGAGSHEAWPEGNVDIEVNSGILTLHMRYLSLQYVLDRKAAECKRLSSEDRELGLGSHFLWSKKETTKHFNYHLAESTQIIP
jgi:glycosyltransferase involved in cell wall biosynthesis